MSQENVEITERLLDSYNRRDLSVSDEVTTADFEFFPAVSGSIESGGGRGREGVQRYYEMLDETWEDFRLVAEEFRDLGDRVLVLGRTEGRGRGSGVPVDAPWAGIWEFRDGKVWHAHGYLDHGEAFRAAGLME